MSINYNKIKKTMLKFAAILAATAFVASTQNLTVADKAFQHHIDREVQGRGRQTKFVPRGQSKRGLKGSKSPKSPSTKTRLTNLELTVVD